MRSLPGKAGAGMAGPPGLTVKVDALAVRRPHGRVDERDQAGPGQDGGQGGQYPADAGVDQRPQHVPPGGRVAGQPHQPLPEPQPAVAGAGRRLVRHGDRHPGPLTGQPPDLVGQPAQRQQRAGHEEPADAQPGGHQREAGHEPVIPGRPVADDQDTGANRGEDDRHQRDQQQEQAGQHRPGQREPAEDADDAPAGAPPQRDPLPLALRDHRRTAHDWALPSAPAAAPASLAGGRRSPQCTGTPNGGCI